MPPFHLRAGSPHVVRVTVSTPIRPTEDPAKVEAALHRFFPGAEVQRAPDALKATTGDLQPFRSRVWELRIIDTVRGQLLHGLQGYGGPTPPMALAFRLSKQAAAAGKVSFPPTPHPLGDLEVRVEVEPGDPWPTAEALAWWLCPETKDGEIVGPA
jgi:predicted RNA binding protein with dsRBD fold (UPF0201 family)